MSKRFGRNQKRRMRQEIGSLEALRTRDQHAIDNLRDRVESHRDFFEYVLEIVGPGSIINPEPEGIERINKAAQIEVLAIEPFNVWSDASVMAAQMAIAHTLLTDVMKDKLRGALHFRARLRDGETHYALTDAAVAVLPRRALERVLYREIARQLAHQLALELKR